MGQCCAQLCRQSKEEEGNTAGSSELAGGNVHLVTDVENWEEIISQANKNAQIVVVNFSASWCNPCRIAAPAYRYLADKYTSVKFLTVDVDNLAEFSNSWDIKATPTFIFLKEGRQMDRMVGGSKHELEKRILSMVEASVATPR
ncbi:unnamed protein product [Cuscuta epithymum]|uniref:Thioredoxin domain-containing protein n=1 Tax=Cuscuta epithymum TaxID=186058 RepID=A0AAV0C3R5_9ASTE|nr:unnamed protein product [Cuscuta epithymum]CAH9139673.1 unnamed protein product [Cuscuta epithymum]